MSLVKKLAGETAIYGLSHIISKVLFFMIFTWYLTRTLGRSEYGIYAEMYSYATVILTILTFRLDTAFFRYGSKSEDKDSVFSTVLYPVIFICILVLLILVPNAEIIAGWIKYEQAPHYIIWFGWILCFDAIASLVYAKLRLASRPIRFLIYRLANVVLTIVLVLFFFEYAPKYHPEMMSSIESSLGITRRIDYVFLSNLIASAVTLLVMVPELVFRGRFDGSLFKKMMIYSIPLVFVSIAANINQAFAAPIQKFFLGSNYSENMSEVGLYAAAAKIAILLNLFTTAFNYAAEPFFFNNSDKKNAKEVYGKVALAFVLFSCLVSLGIVFYLDIFIMILGEEYRSGAHIVPILLMAYVLLGLYYNVGIWFKLSDKTIYGALISTVGMVITLVVSISLLPSIGTVASAYAAFFCYLTMVILGYFLGQKHYPIPYPMCKISMYIGATILLIYGSLFLRGTIDNALIFHLLMSMIIGVIIYYLYKKEYKEIVAF